MDETPRQHATKSNAATRQSTAKPSIMYIHIYMCMHVHTYIHTYIHTHKHTHTSARPG